MYKAYKFRLYPTKEQEIMINKTIGCTRFIYNYFLSECKKNGYKKVYEMCNEIKELVKEYPWLSEVDSCSLRCACFNLEDAYKRYFNKVGGYPKFKSKNNRGSYRTNCIRSTYKGRNYSNIEINKKENTIKLSKIGIVEIRGYRNKDSIEGKIINATITKEVTNKYYVSVVVEEEEIRKEKGIPTNIVGIDLGVKDLIITSNGEKYNNPKELMKKEKRLKRLQRKLARQIKESNNYRKTRIKIANIYSKIKNSRKHNLITIVNKIVKENDIIVSENLFVQKMHNTHNLTKYIRDASFNKIINLLKWKCSLRGKYYYQVDKYYPSSKICSHCGEKTNKTEDLSIRSWECDRCHHINDRDINASINIMDEGIRLHYCS